MGVTGSGFGLYAGGGGGSAVPSEDMSYGVASGTNTYAVTLSPAITEYTTGLFISVKFTNANTSITPTLNCDSLGAKTIVSINSEPLYGNQIVANGVYNMVYDGTNLVLLNSIPSFDNRIINKTATNQTNVTGTTNNTITYSFEITGNALISGDVLDFALRNIFTGTLAQKTTRVYLNSSNSLSGATLIATYTAGNTSLSVDISRRIAVKTSSIMQVYTAAISSVSSDLVSTTAVTEASVDTTSSIWLINAIQLANSADAGVLSFFKLTN